MKRGDASLTPDPPRRFLQRITIILIVSAVLALFGVYQRTQALIDGETLDSARSYTDLIVAVREWNARLGGVWVVKRPGVTTNKYLVEMGVSADATTTDGRVFTLRNPALMTREISDVLKNTGGVSFRLTSLKPINPASTPDGWERASLVSFAAGASEAWTTVVESGAPVLRYMRPLVTDRSCLTCHAQQGYRVGDIRGAISVTIPLDRQVRDATANAALIAVTAAAITALLLLATFGLVRGLRRQLDAAQAALVDAAMTDELTRLASRHHTMERLREEIERARRTGQPLALIMADIDHFKTVNDTHGHGVGDHVLKAIAGRMTRALRPYDLLGRIGGEEFLIIAPDADLDGAVAIAERARTLICEDPIATDGNQVDMTASFGVTMIAANEESAFDRSLARVDAALYASKEAGRNRVSVVEQGPPK
jgi:diguanylate cyclase (GGDEF)-like protein